MDKLLQNRVLALELSESFDEAFSEASRLLREGIRTPLLACLFIRNARTDVDLTEHRVIINDYCASQEDVNLALATKYLQWEQIAPASEAANRAASLAPDSAHAAFSQGMVAHQNGLHGKWHNRKDSFQKAVSFYSKAITAAERDKHFGLLPNIYVNRGRAQALCGNTDEAANDFRKAINLSNTPSLFAEDAVLFFLNVDDQTSALELAPLLDTTSKEGAFLSAVANYHNINGDEKQEHIRQFIKQANQDFDRATEVRFYCVQWALEIKAFDLARQCVPQAFVDQMPFQGNTLLAYIALENGNQELARTYANIVLESRGLNVRRNEIDFFATLLLRLRDDEKALPLLEQVATPGVLDEACKRLITCAQRLERHDTLLRVCSELRMTNQHDNLTRKLEVQLLSKYSPQEAFNVATQFLQYEKPYFTAARNYLALRLGNPEAIEFDENNPPSAEDFGLEDAYLVITPLVKTQRFREAIVFSYYHLRKYFDTEIAHVHFAALMLNYGSRAGATLPHPEVNRESAINLKNLTTGETRWLVIEDDSPELIRNEMPSTAPTIQSLLGKRVSDVVHFRDTSVQDQKEEIIAIQPKYLHIFQDVFSHFQSRFSGSCVIQSIYLGDGDNFDPSPLVESAKNRREFVQKAFHLYRDNLCSLHLFASHLGVDLRKAIIGLTLSEEHGIRCVDCEPELFSVMPETLSRPTKMVLDISAVISISRLEAWDSLDHDCEYIASRSTKDSIELWLHEITEQDNQPSAISFLDDSGNLTIQEITPQQAEAERNEVRTMAQNLLKFCSIKDATTVANIAPKQRDKYFQVLGLQSLEAIDIARSEKAILWTDDYVVATIAKMDFDVERTWTQSAFNLFAKMGRLDASTYSEITTKLCAWNYVTSVWEPKDLVTAGQLCNWDASAWPLRQCIRLIGTSTGSRSKKAFILNDFFKQLRRSKCIEIKQSSVIQAALGSVGDVTLVRALLKNVQKDFPIDFYTANFLAEEYAYWLNNNKNIILPQP